VLFKQIDGEGVVFYTNYHSRKAAELEANPWASITVYWRGLERQVRMEGTVERTTREISEAYFASRPRGSQLGAWASQQSSPAADRRELNEALARIEAEYAGKAVPCPPHWGGYRLRPARAEFWQGRSARLHDRFVYTREDDGAWKIQRLHP
jgi:pyridoxamine 5'-phosphate oxidase